MNEIQIEILEVWNHDARSERLAIITSSPHRAKLAVWDWIHANRPDLQLAIGLDSHGYVAQQK